MKKIFLTLLLMLLPMCIYAKGSVNVSTTNINVVVGNTKTITVNATDAAGRIDITSSNSSIASVSSSNIFLDNQSKKITITAKKVGKTTIVVKATDVTTYDDEDLSGKTYTINVTVTNKTTSSNSSTSSKSKTSTTKKSLSNNNSLKSISVTDYDLIKTDNKIYSLEVPYNVESITINATAEDSTAKVEGTGLHRLDFGENDIKVIITSESGIENEIRVLVTRKFETEENIIEEKEDNVELSNFISTFYNLKSNIWFIASLIEFIIIIVLFIMCNLFMKKAKKSLGKI